MKKFVSLILAFIMLLSMGITVFAADTTTDKVTIATPMAEELNKLGILKGSDKGYELDRPITRAETMVVIIRLIGKEFEASKYTKKHNFTDVPEWASKYVAFAKDNGITDGTSETTFGSNDFVTARQFLTFIYRALGYMGWGNECSYETVFSFAQSKNLIKEGEYSDKTKFIRADMVILATRALTQTFRFSDCTLKDIATSTKVPETGFINTRGEGVWMEAGTFMDTPNCPLPVIDKSLSYEENRQKLNDYLMDTHFCAIHYDGIYTGLGIGFGAGFIQHEDGRYGIKVFGWRDEYDILNPEVINAILETMYFLSGDREVAYALWSWFDSKNINGYSNTDYFGFRDTSSSENGFNAIMNAIEVEITESDGITTVYFK